MAELARIEAEPLGELPEIYRKQPIYYFTNRFSVRGTNTTVKWPSYSQVMDYELEFGIVTRSKGACLAVFIPATRKGRAAWYTACGSLSALGCSRAASHSR